MVAVRPGRMLAQPATSNTCRALVQDLDDRGIRLFCLINEGTDSSFDTSLFKDGHRPKWSFVFNI